MGIFESKLQSIVQQSYANEKTSNDFIFEPLFHTLMLIDFISAVHYSKSSVFFFSFFVNTNCPYRSKYILAK